MEFIVKTNLETELPKAIDFNFDALKNELTKRIENYKSLVVTEESIKSAKEDKAALNNLKKALEDKRISIKKEILAPYNVFEAKVKELVALIDEPVKAIDTQLKVFDDMRKQAKADEIEALYQQYIGDRGMVLPLDKISDPRWLNVTYNIKTIETEIQERIAQFDSDIAVLDSVQSEFAEVVKIKYLDTLNLGEALKERARLQLQAENMREREKELAEQKAREAQRAAQRVPEVQEVPEPVAEQIEFVPQEKLYRLAFECNVTVTQAQELGQWLSDNGIEYRRIK